MELLILNHTMMDKYLHSIYFNGIVNSNTFIISYYGEGEKKVNFANCKARVLQLMMDDVRVVNDVKKFYEDNHDNFISIANFIKEAKENNKNIICQCNAGISRSAATAKAIKEFYDHNGKEIDDSGEYIPNLLFYDCIIKALNEVNKK